MTPRPAPSRNPPSVLMAAQAAFPEQVTLWGKVLPLKDPLTSRSSKGTLPTTPGSPEATADSRALPGYWRPPLHTTHKCTHQPRCGQAQRQTDSHVETHVPAWMCTHRKACAHRKCTDAEMNTQMRAGTEQWTPPNTCAHEEVYTQRHRYPSGEMCACACPKLCGREDPGTHAPGFSPRCSASLQCALERETTHVEPRVPYISPAVSPMRDGQGRPGAGAHLPEASAQSQGSKSPK